MKLKEAFRRIVIAPVIGGIILGCVSLGACAPKTVYVGPPTDFMCSVMLLSSTECGEDTIGWIGSAEDGRFVQVKA